MPGTNELSLGLYQPSAVRCEAKRARTPNVLTLESPSNHRRGNALGLHLALILSDSGRDGGHQCATSGRGINNSAGDGVPLHSCFGAGHLKTDLLSGISSESVIGYSENDVQSPSLDRMLQLDPARARFSAKGGDVVVGVSGDNLVPFARSERLASTNLVSSRRYFRIVTDAGVYGGSEHGA